MDATLPSAAQQTDLGPLPDDMPDKLGKYQLKGELGRGACGVVYRGIDPFVQRDVAVKVARVGDAETAQAEFFKEARAAGRLQHPHIVSLFDAGVEGDLAYLVMEYIRGDTLHPHAHNRNKRLPTDQVIDIIFKCLTIPFLNTSLMELPFPFSCQAGGFDPGLGKTVAKYQWQMKARL